MKQDERQSWRTTVESKIREAHFLSFGCRAEEIHREEIQSIHCLIDRLDSAKAKAIREQDEDAANEILSWELLLRGITSELLMWLALKSDDSNKAWDQCVNAEMNYRLATRAHEWGTEFDATYLVSRVNALQRILFPKPIFASVGVLIKESRCSICESIYGECDHIAGTPYMGKLATRIVVDADLLEVSIVEKPADKSARTMTVPTKDGYRDFMSWRIVEGPKADAGWNPK